MDTWGGSGEGCFQVHAPGTLVSACATHGVCTQISRSLFTPGFPSHSEANARVRSVHWACFKRRGLEHNQAFKVEPQ